MSFAGGLITKRVRNKEEIVGGVDNACDES